MELRPAEGLIAGIKCRGLDARRRFSTIARGAAGLHKTETSLAMPRRTISHPKTLRLVPADPYAKETGVFRPTA